MGGWVSVTHLVYLNCCTLPSILVLLYVGFLCCVCICTHVIDQIGCNETGQADQKRAMACVRACTVARLGWGGFGAMMCTMNGVGHDSTAYVVSVCFV
jgi:hypothetical protein